MKQCPFCGQSYPAFIAGGATYPVLRDLKVIGAGWRKNVLCPNCRSTDRERLVYLYLLHRTDFFRERPQQKKVLHVAPEKNLETKLRAADFEEYTTCDLHRGDVDLNYDISDLPLDDHSFDLIICNHVLEHVYDVQRALSELYRVLRPEGRAILQVPISPILPGTIEDSEITSPEDRAWKFGQSDHRRIFGEDFPDILSLAGFRVDVFNWNTSRKTFGGLRNRYALIRDERVYIGRKPAS